jgi:hypothetical protein
VIPDEVMKKVGSYEILGTLWAQSDETYFENGTAECFPTVKMNPNDTFGLS